MNPANGGLDAPAYAFQGPTAPCTNESGYLAWWVGGWVGGWVPSLGLTGRMGGCASQPHGSDGWRCSSWSPSSPTPTPAPPTRAPSHTPHSHPHPHTPRFEVKQLYIAAGGQVSINAPGKAAYLQLGNTWVSFDLPQTIYLKIKAARALKLGGLMVGAAPASSPLPHPPLLPASAAGGRGGSGWAPFLSAPPIHGISCMRERAHAGRPPAPAPPV